MKLLLLTKKECRKCEFVKKHIGQYLNNGISEIDAETPEGMSLLAYYELVESNQFPILIEDEAEKVVTGAIKIKQEVEEIYKK